MLRLKKGVLVSHLTAPEMWLAAYVVDKILVNNYRVVYTTITSGLEGKHGAKSLHPLGKAFDFRTNDWPAGKAEAITTEIRKALGPQYDVVLEIDHLHCEHQPKGKR
jgi:hypothetical protein